MIIDKISRIYRDLSQILGAGDYDAAILETLYLAELAWLLKVKGISSITRLHNVEAEYVSSLSPEILRAASYKIMSIAEAHSLKKHGNLATISVRDKALLKRLYGVEAAYLGPTVRASRKLCREDYEEAVERLGIPCRGYILFVGSPHKPSIDAINMVLRELSRKRLPLDLVVAGSISKYIEKRYRGTGARILGVVSEKTLRALMCCAEGSIAPVVSGGGVPIKLIESILYGIPTITSERALKIIPGLRHGENVLVMERVGGIWGRRNPCTGWGS